MSVRISGLLLGAALALTATAAEAAEDVDSANYVMQGCRAVMGRDSHDEPIRQGYCMGTVNGIVLMGHYMNSSLQSFPLPQDDYRRRRLCIDVPDEAPLSQEIRVVIAYIDARPARMHEPFYQLALEALRTAWPCK
jgi:hypothetical protein